MSQIRNERGVVLSWLVKIGAILAVLGVILFDAGSIAVNYVTLDSAANDVAIDVSIQVDTGPPSQYTDNEIFLIAKEVVDKDVAGARVLRRGTSIDDQGVVHILLARKAQTLVARYISALEGLYAPTASGQSGTN